MFLKEVRIALAADNNERLDRAWCASAFGENKVNEKKIHSAPRHIRKRLILLVLVVQVKGPKNAPTQHSSENQESRSSIRCFAKHMVRISLLRATPSRHTCKVLSNKDTESFHTGDSSILGKGNNACSVRPRAKTLIFKAGGRESVLLNIEVEELTRANCVTQKLAQVSETMGKGIETFIQPGRKLLHRAEEALMRLTSRGYR